MTLKPFDSEQLATAEIIYRRYERAMTAGDRVSAHKHLQYYFEYVELMVKCLATPKTPGDRTRGVSGRT